MRLCQKNESLWYLDDASRAGPGEREREVELVAELARGTLISPPAPARTKNRASRDRDWAAVRL